MRYIRIEKYDGARSWITPEELRARLAKRISLVDEEMTRIDRGALFEDEHAWYAKEFVMGVKGTLEQNVLEQAEEGRESHVITYGGSFYLITPDGMEHFGDFGAEVCAQEMTSASATYQVLLSEGVTGLPRPEELDVDVLDALCGLTSQADYFIRSIVAGEFVELTDTARAKIADNLLPGIREKLERAERVVEKLKKRATPTPRLIELRLTREHLMSERLRVEITALLLRYDPKMTEGVRFFSRIEWNQRGEEFGRDAILTLTYEGNLFYELMNGGTEGQQLRLDLEILLQGLGYCYEPNINWSLSVYQA